MPRIENRECSLDGTKEEKKDRFVHQFKVANRSFSVAESSPARAGTKWSEREKGSDYAPGDSKGRSPWRAFGDFPRDGKVTRVPSMAKPCSRGAPARRGVGAKSDNLLPRGASPSQKSPSPAGPLGIAAALPVKNYPNNSVQISGISGSSVRTTSLPKSSAVSPSRRRRATTTSRASANS